MSCVCFLSQEEISVRQIGDNLLKHQIRRCHLLNPDLLSTLELPPTVSNGMVVDVYKFGKYNRSVNLKAVLRGLGVDDTISDAQLYQKLDDTNDRHKSLAKSKGNSQAWAEKCETF